MTFDQVLVFHKIVEAGSFKMAAAELNKTQPAISFSIKKLEEEIGAELFDRSGYRPELTAHGKAFLEKSQRALQGMFELEGLSRSFRENEEPEIGISVDGISPLPELLKLFKNFGDRFFNTKLNMSFDVLTECERRVLNKEVLIGLTHFISEPNALEVLKISQVIMLPVMDKVLFEEKNVFSQERLMDIDQVVIGDKNKTGKASFGLLEGGRKWHLSDANLKKEIIFAGLGWGHMPLHYVERELQENKLVVLDFPDIHKRVLDIHLIRLKKNQFGPVAKALWDELSALSHGPGL
jgi:DNA-binding transcriptional LysR family regulator